MGIYQVRKMRRGEALGLSGWVLLCILHAQCAEGIPFHSEDAVVTIERSNILLHQEEAQSGRALEGRKYSERRLLMRDLSDQTLGEANLQPTDMQEEIDQEVAIEEATEREQMQKDVPVEDQIE